jgi:hypothetical protein
VPTVATVDVGASLDERALYPVFASAEEGAAEVERLFAEDLHWARASARCREYFDRRHSRAEVLARYERVFESLLAARD